MESVSSSSTWENTAAAKHAEAELNMNVGMSKCEASKSQETADSTAEASYAPPPIPEGPIDLPTFLEHMTVQLEYHRSFHLSLCTPIKTLLERFDGSCEDLARYMHFDPERNYTRNLISTDNETYTLLALCWNPGRESPIHDHPCEGCWMKVVSGTVTETRYAKNATNNKLEQIQVSEASAPTVLYIDDNIGLHKVSNYSTDKLACTLHLYSPPFQRCCIWLSDNQCADKPAMATSTFFSEYGQRVAYEEPSPLVCREGAAPTDAFPSAAAGPSDSGCGGSGAGSP